MFVRHLSLTDFRSWPSVELDLVAGVNVLVGPNAAGKTNLAEALVVLATHSSHRVSTGAPLVRAGAQRAVLRAAALSGERELRVELEITPGAANRARLNGAAVPRARDALGAVTCVLFAPEDLAIVRGDPGERRRYLDELLVQRSPRLAAVRSDYDRSLKQRGTLLKSAGAGRRFAGEGALATLAVWDGHLARHGAELVAARLRLVAALGPHVVEAYARLAPASEPLSLAYRSALPEDLLAQDPDRPDAAAEIEAALLDALLDARPRELERGVNLVGPHRDELDIRLGELPVRGYASHGESWSTALALRLGSFELLRGEVRSGGDPVLVLDDVFAELDQHRREQLRAAAESAEQTIITAAVGADVPAFASAALFDVAGGQVRRAG